MCLSSDYSFSYFYILIINKKLHESNSHGAIKYKSVDGGLKYVLLNPANTLF